MENREGDPGILGDLDILHAILEFTAAGMLVVAKGAAIRLANSAAERITGYPRHELEGMRKWTDLVLAEDQGELKKLLQMLKAGKADAKEFVECRIVDSRGIIRTVQVSGNHHKDSGLTILSLLNITQQKENELLLKAAKEKAEASERLKTSFLGNLSHEIRTPMNAIMGFASLLQEEDLPVAKKRMYLTQILNGSSDLLQLIDKTVILSRIDLGQLKINRRQLFVNKTLTDLHAKYQRIIADKGKDIELALEPGRPEADFAIQADIFRITDILNNLIDNAVKFTESGKITVGYTYREDEPEQGFDSLLFYVRDTGCGISEEKSGIIFDRFVKLVDKNETVLRGAGLGLAISKELVKMMGGSIWLDSVPGKGSTFFFTLPINYTKFQQVREKDQGKDPVSEDWSPYTLLVAEDMESNYLYVKELLLPTNIKVLRARDGLEAVELFEEHPDIDLILMDILMPGLDGYEATVKIRSIRQEVAVVAQTAFTFEGELQDGLYAGCFNDYIMKPFSRDMLVANLKKHLPDVK